MTLNIFLFMIYCHLLIVTSEVALETNNIYCNCSTCRNNGDEVDRCLLKIGGQCFAALDNELNETTNKLQVTRSTGCISEDAELQCHGDLVNSYYGRSIKCCNYTDFCNNNLNPEITHSVYHPPSGIELFLTENWLYIISFVIILLTVVALLIFRYIRMKNIRNIESKSCLIEESRVGFLTNHDFSSGSGQGKPFMIQTTIGRKFVRLRCLSKEIKPIQLNVGRLNGTEIVEKVFTTYSEYLWKTERSVYETALLRHNNVLGYIGSDILGSGLKTIYTDYHPLGSLRSYLQNTQLSRQEFLVLVKSAAAGLEHLHTEIVGAEKRPAIAHRNITSNNIVVNVYKECVITNFENALMYMNANECFDKPDNIHVGSPRYMAPEIIKSSININSFDEFKKADIYSLGLIFYEICQRCVTVVNDKSTCEEYSLPLSKFLPCTPTLEDMIKLMMGKIEDLIIPEDRWLNDKTLLKLFWYDVLKECIRDNPSSRSTIFRIRKKIDSIMNAYYDNL